MRQTEPSSWMCIPLRNWFVETVSATAGAVRPGGDDRLEGGPVGAELAEELVQPVRQLALAPADEALLREPVVRLARDRPRAADRVELLLVLNRAQRLDEAAARDEVEPARPQGFPLCVSHRGRLEADASVEQLRQRR